MSASRTNTAVETIDDVTAPVLLGPWALMWRKFKRHRVAYYSLYVVGLIYLMAFLGEFLTPVQIHETNTRRAFAPPQAAQRIPLRSGRFG